MAFALKVPGLGAFEGAKWVVKARGRRSHAKSFHMKQERWTNLEGATTLKEFGKLDRAHSS